MRRLRSSVAPLRVSETEPADAGARVREVEGAVELESDGAAPSGPLEAQVDREQAVQQRCLLEEQVAEALAGCSNAALRR